MPWSVIGAVAGGLLQSSAAKKAAKAQTDAATQAITEQRRQYDVTRADQTPFRETGVRANQRLSYLMGLDGGRSGAGTPEYEAIYNRIMGDVNSQHQAQFGMTLEASNNYEGIQMQRDAAKRQAEAEYQQKYGSQAQPAGGAGAAGPSGDPFAFDQFYQSGLKFGLDQGTGAINARAIAGGGYDSGATLKALTRYANDYGSTKANEVYNRLAGLQGSGMLATNQTQAAGQNMANQVSEFNTQAGNARAAGIIGGARAWTDALKTMNQGYNNYQDRKAYANYDPYGGSYGGGYYGGGGSYYGGGGGYGGGTQPEPYPGYYDYGNE